MIELMQDPHFWVECAFGLFLVLVFVFARHKILAAIDARRFKIAADIEHASQLLKEADALKVEADKMMQDAAKRADEILVQAQIDAKTLVKEAGNRAEHNAAKKMQALEARIKAEEQKIMADAKVAVADLSVQCAREILRETLNSKSGNDKNAQSVFTQSLQTISTQKIGA